MTMLASLFVFLMDIRETSYRVIAIARVLRMRGRPPQRNDVCTQALFLLNPYIVSIIALHSNAQLELASFITLPPSLPMPKSFTSYLPLHIDNPSGARPAFAASFCAFAFASLCLLPSFSRFACFFSWRRCWRAALASWEDERPWSSDIVLMWCIADLCLTDAGAGQTS